MSEQSQDNSHKYIYHLFLLRRWKWSDGFMTSLRTITKPLRYNVYTFCLAVFKFSEAGIFQYLDQLSNYQTQISEINLCCYFELSNFVQIRQTSEINLWYHFKLSNFVQIIQKKYSSLFWHKSQAIYNKRNWLSGTQVDLNVSKNLDRYINHFHYTCKMHYIKFDIRKQKMVLCHHRYYNLKISILKVVWQEQSKLMTQNKENNNWKLKEHRVEHHCFAAFSASLFCFSCCTSWIK